MARGAAPDRVHAGLTRWPAIRFADYMDGLRFLLKVGELAEAMDHHPRIDIRYKNIRFALTTRADGGPSEKDMALAHQINQAVEHEALE